MSKVFLPQSASLTLDYLCNLGVPLLSDVELIPKMPVLPQLPLQPQSASATLDLSLSCVCPCNLGGFSRMLTRTVNKGCQKDHTLECLRDLWLISKLTMPLQPWSCLKNTCNKCEQGVSKKPHLGVPLWPWFDPWAACTLETLKFPQKFSQGGSAKLKCLRGKQALWEEQTTV